MLLLHAWLALPRKQNSFGSEVTWGFFSKLSAKAREKQTSRIFHFACPVSLILSCQAVYFPTMTRRGFSVCGDLRQGEHGRQCSSVSMGTLGLSCSDAPYKTSYALGSAFLVEAPQYSFLGKPSWSVRMEKPEGQGRRVTSSHRALDSGALPATLLSQG